LKLAGQIEVGILRVTWYKNKKGIPVFAKEECPWFDWIVVTSAAKLVGYPSGACFLSREGTLLYIRAVTDTRKLTEPA